jgi:tRNA (guanosine-2'-O-)-methyltransferase
MNPTDFITEDRLDKLKKVLGKRTDSLTVVLENVHDPHNLSAVVRSCDAVGILEIYLIYHSGQEPRRLERISSASASKWMKVHYFDSVSDCYNAVRSTGKKIYTTHMSKDSVSLYSLNLSEPVALVFGNEHEGVTEEAYTTSDGNFLIPQVGMIQSLNISVAAAVSLFEAFRQRLDAGFYEEPQISTGLYNATLLDWAAKTRG